MNIGYLTPEWMYFVDKLRPYAFWLLATAIYGGWVWIIVWNNAPGWIIGERVIAAIAGLAGAYISATVFERNLRKCGGGYGFALRGSKRFKAEFMRGQYRFWMGDCWIMSGAERPHSFAMREPGQRYEEARAEERFRSQGGGQFGDHYRRAWDITRDAGSSRIVIATVMGEKKAREIIRQLQELDNFARGLDASGTRTKENSTGGGAPSGRRPQLD